MLEQRRSESPQSQEAGGLSDTGSFLQYPGLLQMRNSVPPLMKETSVLIRSGLTPWAACLIHFKFISLLNSAHGELREGRLVEAGGNGQWGEGRNSTSSGLVQEPL